MPIVKEDGSKSSASLWLKEKANETGSCVYIWIFEEVFETVTHVSIDAKVNYLCVTNTTYQSHLYYLYPFFLSSSFFFFSSNRDRFAT
jgi:hypothetical protein